MQLRFFKNYVSLTVKRHGLNLSHIFFNSTTAMVLFQVALLHNMGLVELVDAEQGYERTSNMESVRGRL